MWMADWIARRVVRDAAGRRVRSLPVVSTYSRLVNDAIQRRRLDRYVRELDDGTIEFAPPEFGPLYFPDRQAVDFLLVADELQFLRYVVRHLDGGTVFDVGAHIGTHSIAYATTADVVAFEPAAPNVRLFEEHVAINEACEVPLREIAVERVALADECGEGAVYVTDEAVAGRSYDSEAALERGAAVGAAEQPVETRRLDALDLPPPDALKVDVEGAELDALRGAEETLREHRPELFIEAHPPKLPSFGHTVEDLLAYLESLGYDAREVLPLAGPMEYYHAIADGGPDGSGPSRSITND